MFHSLSNNKISIVAKQYLACLYLTQLAIIKKYKIRVIFLLKMTKYVNRKYYLFRAHFIPTSQYTYQYYLTGKRLNGLGWKFLYLQKILLISFGTTGIVL